MPFTTKGGRVTLWIIQVLLAAVFLFAGGFKLAMPLAALAKATPLPPLLIKFVAACEVTGAFGLVLPGLLHKREGLTPLAAAGLVIIMIGATITTLAMQGLHPPLFPIVLPMVVGTLAAIVAWGRRDAGRGAPSSPQ